MKNRGLIITLIVLLIIVIILLSAFLGLSLNGRFSFKNWGTKKSDQVIFDNSYEVAGIESLEVLSTAGDIDFEESTDGKIRVVVYGEKEEDLKVELNANQLKVDYSKYKHKKISFGFNFYINNIIIYLPKDYASEISVKANYGDINAIDLENASINIEEDCGDVTLGKVKNAVIKNHYGDIKIQAIHHKTQIESDCGDVKIASLHIEEDSSIVNNFGDIKIGQTNEIFIDAKTDLGDVKVNQNNRHGEITLKIKNDCGDIKVEN